MKRTTIIILAFAVICVARPLYLFALSECETPPVSKQGFEDPNMLIGTHLASIYAIHNQDIVWTFDTCINDPTLVYKVVGSVPVVGHTVTWRGAKGIHHLYFQMIAINTDSSSGEVTEEVIDEGTIFVKCLPRGQFKGVVWQ